MRNFLHSLILMLIGFVVFCNVLFSPFYLDDISQIVNNESIKFVGNIPALFTQNNSIGEDKKPIIGYFYKPVFYSTYSLLYFIGKGSVFPFHLFQVILYSFNAALVFLLFTKFFERRLAFLMAMIFLVHPANEEVAQYVAAIQDVLYFWFGMIAIYLVSGNWIGKIKTVVISSFSILLSLLSKETGLLFLLAIGLYVYLFQKRMFKFYLLSFSIVGLIYLFLRVSAVSNPTFFMSETSRNRTLSQRLILAPKVVDYYFEEMLTPSLSLPNIDNLKNNEINSAPWPFLKSFFIITVFICIGLIIRKYFTIWFLRYSFFFIWMMLGIGLHSQIIPLDVLIASRWMYFTMVGMLGMLGVMVMVLKPYFFKYKTLIFILYLLYLGTCIYGTERLNTYRGTFGSESDQSHSTFR